MRISWSAQIQKDIAFSRNQYGVFVLIFLFGVCASALMYWITSQGPGVSPDSIIYLNTADSLLTGNGFTAIGKPMTHYPPVFPLLLAGTVFFTGTDILSSARLVTVFFFGANLVLTGTAVYLFSKRNLPATVCAMLLFISSAPIISIHSVLGSEAPFISFTTAGFIFLAGYILRPNLYYLVSASLMFGIAAATRYIGFTLFPSVIFSLFILCRQSFWSKFKSAAIFLGIAGLPVVSWMIRNLLITQSATNRTATFHPFNLTHVKNLITGMYGFWLPISVSIWIKTFHIAMVIILFGWVLKAYFRKQGSVSSLTLPLILAIYSVLYVILLFVSISFFDAHTPVDCRLLLPVYLALVIASAVTIAASSKVYRSLLKAFTVIVFFSVSINTIPAISAAVRIHGFGNEYSTKAWQNALSIKLVYDIPADMVIYSNGPDAIWLITRKDAQMLPLKIVPYTLMPNKNYHKQINQVITQCEKGTAVIIYLDRITWRPHLPSKQEISSLFRSPLVLPLKDGLAYGHILREGDHKLEIAKDD
ncbi:MAG: hypothetical protein PHV59_02525 [Victivallales bacterium]|nr:hypothetical protein [Victivallales bacterium]